MRTAEHDRGIGRLMKKQSRRPQPNEAHILPGGGSGEHSRSRRRSRGANLLSLIVLILLALIFLARRVMVAANPHRVIGRHAANSESGGPTGEELSPADKRALDKLIQHPAHP
jgi:hypothetical protein